MPPEFFSNIKRLRDNNTQISFKGNPTTTPTPLPKPYGMDGAITIYDNTNLYVGMRRGGRALYAFNVTDIVAATPQAPQLLWKRGCPVNLTGTGAADDTGCSAGYSGLGQTWSAPKIMKAAGYKDGERAEADDHHGWRLRSLARTPIRRPTPASRAKRARAYT